MWRHSPCGARAKWSTDHVEYSPCGAQPMWSTARVETGASPVRPGRSPAASTTAHTMRNRSILTLAAALLLTACSPRDYLTRRLATDLISASDAFKTPQQYVLQTGVISNKDYRLARIYSPRTSRLDRRHQRPLPRRPRAAPMLEYSADAFGSRHRSHHCPRRRD